MQKDASGRASELGDKPNVLRVRPPVMYSLWRPAADRAKSILNPRASWFAGHEASSSVLYYAYVLCVRMCMCNNGLQKGHAEGHLCTRGFRPNCEYIVSI